MEQTKESVLIEPLPLKQAARVFRAINHPLRQRILRLLDKAGQIIVSDIYRKLKIEQSVASQHLAILRGAGLVTTQREGKRIFYSVNYKIAEQLTK